MRRRHCLLPFAQSRRAACARIPKKRKGSPVVELPFGWSPQHPHAARRGKSDVQRRQKIGHERLAFGPACQAQEMPQEETPKEIIFSLIFPTRTNLQPSLRLGDSPSQLLSALRVSRPEQLKTDFCSDASWKLPNRSVSEWQQEVACWRRKWAANKIALVHRLGGGS